MASQTFSSSTTWIAPAGVTSVLAECWAAGGSGARGAQSATGGAGGGYANKTVSVTPGNSYTVTVGVGGTAIVATNNSNGNVGGDSWFSTSGTVIAYGGAPGQFSNSAGASSATGLSGIGDVTHTGGSSGSIPNSNGASSSGGGAGAGDTGNGGNSSSPAANSSTTGGIGGTTNGGNGGDASRTNGANAGAGSSIGGGGGGRTYSGTNDANSGAGANGQVKLTWTASFGGSFFMNFI